MLILSQNKITKDGEVFKIKDRTVKVNKERELELEPEQIKEAKKEDEEEKPKVDPVLEEMKKREQAALAQDVERQKQREKLAQ